MRPSSSGTTSRRSTAASTASAGAGSSTALQTTPSTSHTYAPSPIDAILSEQGLQRYHIEPPTWTAPWLADEPPTGANTGLMKLAGKTAPPAGVAGGAAAGWADGKKQFPLFYPPRDGMEEDQMTEQVVKAGYASKAIVQAETFSAHQHIYDKLKTTDILGNLSRLVSAVQAKADSSLPSYGPSTFRLPSRITLTDSKREAWFSDLASPAVPLSKLSRSVPHGYKGEKGLDMLAHRRVDVPRAVWFVRAFGGVEIQSLAKTRPASVAIAQYTTEFTTVVCEFVRKQLAEVVLPSPAPARSTPAPSPAPLPGTPGAAATRARSASTASLAGKPPQPAGAGLMDEEKRKAWEGKFEYTVRLVSHLYSAALLDQSHFLRFLISLLEPSSSSSSSLGQLSFVVLLIEDHLADIFASETATARLVRGSLLRLQQLDHSPPSSLRTSLTNSLTTLVRSAFLANPDAFVPLVPLVPSTIYSLSTSLGQASADVGQRLQALLLDDDGGAAATAGRQTDDEDPLLRSTIEADLEELKLRRAFPAAALAAADSSASSAATAEPGEGRVAGDRALLAAIKRLDEIEYPAKMQDVHRALFLSPSVLVPATPAAAAAATPASNAMQPSTSCASSSHQSSRPPLPTSPSSPPALPISLTSALPLFFTWSTTPTRPGGPHRRYAVARLIVLEVERLSGSSSASSGHVGGKVKGERASARLSAKKADKTGARVSVEDAFVRWVDEQFPASTTVPTTPAPGSAAPSSASGAGKMERDDVRALAEELIRAGVLSYGAYLQRMIARGETEEGAGEGGEASIHLWILRTVALGGIGGGGARRRVAIGGEAGLQQTLRVEAGLARAKAELQRLVLSPSPFPGAGVSELLSAVRELKEDGAHWSITRDLVPESLPVDAKTGEVRVVREQLAVVVAVYEAAEDWFGMLQLMIALLHRCPPLHLAHHLLAVLETQLATWTALDALSDLGAAVFAAYEALKRAQGGAAERLFLRRLDTLGAAGLLSAKAKAVVDADAASLAAALPAAPPLGSNPLRAPIAEISSLLLDATPSAVSRLATLVSTHYATYDNYPVVAVDGVVQLLPQLPSPEPGVALLSALAGRIHGGVARALARWVEAMTPQQLSATFAGSASAGLPGLLSGLIRESAVSAPEMVKSVILPLWRALLAQALLPGVAGESQQQLDPAVAAALDTVRAVVAALVLPIGPSPRATDMNLDGAALSPNSSPATLALRQRHSSRRASLFSHAHLPLLAQILSLLALQQEALASLSLSRADLADSASALFLQVAALPELQALVARDPSAFSAGMLDGEALRGISGIEGLRPKLLAAVLVVLKDGGAATPANLVSTEDWDLFLSGLTLWRLPISKVEVEACLERLDLDTALSATDKSEALHTLSKHFVDRVCSGEGQSYLGEQVLVSVTFSRLASAFDTLSRPSLAEDDRTSAFTSLRCASRLLDTVLRAGTASSRTASLDELLTAIRACLSCERVAGAKGGTDDDSMQIVLYAARLLVVALGCTIKPAEKTTAEMYRDCLAPLVRLATTFAQGQAQDCELSCIPLDTCSCILFSLPDLSASIRPPSLPSLIIAAPSASLPLDLVPDSTYSRLARLFGPLAPTSLVPNPWELLDHTDPTLAATALVRRANTPQPQLTNGGPIDLAAFRAKVIEKIPAVTALDAMSTTSNGSTATASSSAAAGPLEKGQQTNFDFETPCTNMSVAARDHRRTLAVTRALAARLEQSGAAAVAAQAQAAGNAQASASAAGKKRTAAGETPPTAAATPTPAPPAPAATGRGTKRKASMQAQPDVVVLDSDDDEKAKAPPPAKAKKARSSTGGKTTAGKTTASKTTAGKAPARKKK
ncbi:RNA polymerase II mediator complex subunit [Rhodosporidiobolus nylandii]